MRIRSKKEYVSQEWSGASLDFGNAEFRLAVFIVGFEVKEHCGLESRAQLWQTTEFEFKLVTAVTRVIGLS